MKKELPEVSEATRYKPEYTWNYEIGSHLTLWEGRLLADLSAFYMDTRNQQIAKFAENGLGRITVNAGKSHSYGAEASLRAALTTAFTVNASYGYTYATFKEYATNTKIDGETQPVDYNGNYVPFVPKHTLSLGGQYISASTRDIGWTVFRLTLTTPVQDVSIGPSKMMSVKPSTAH